MKTDTHLGIYTDKEAGPTTRTLTWRFPCPIVPPA